MKTTVHNLRDKDAVAQAKAEGRYVRCDRRSQWGNPYAIGKGGSREEVVRRHAMLALQSSSLSARGWRQEVRRELRDKMLFCWCAPKACHCDVLAKIADSKDDEELEIK